MVVMLVMLVMLVMVVLLFDCWLGDFRSSSLLLVRCVGSGVAGGGSALRLWVGSSASFSWSLVKSGGDVTGVD